jgi:putative peptidoglycan lipid II flippase
MAEALRQYLPLVCGAILIYRGLLLDQAMAATLNPGAVTAFALGGKLVAVVHGLGATALRIATLPYLSGMASHFQWAAFRRTVTRFIRLTVIVSIPAALALFVWAAPLMELLYQRGAFGPEDTRAVTEVHAAFVFQIPFAVLLGLFAPALSALHANRFLVRAVAIAVPLNLFLDYLLARYLGVAGIAIATSLVSAVAVAYLGRCVYSTIGNEERAHRDAILRAGVDR